LLSHGCDDTVLSGVLTGSVAREAPVL